MEWMKFAIVAGILLLIGFGKKLAPKIVGQGKEGADAWVNEISKAVKKEDVEDEEKTE